MCKISYRSKPRQPIDAETSTNFLLENIQYP